MRKMIYLFCLATATMFATTAWGAIVYVDAVPNSNTTLNGNPLVFSGDGENAEEGSGNVGASDDGLWQHRTGYAVNGNTLWQTDIGTSAAETTLPLVTTITGLAPGFYNLYGLFWDQPSVSTDWDASFRVGSTGSFTSFDSGDSLRPGFVTASLAAADSSDFTTTIVVRVGTTEQMYISSLGNFLITGGSVDIYVQGPDEIPGDKTNNSGQRTWYDGVGYEFTGVPEPSAIILVGIGLVGLGTARLRKRK